MAETLSTDLLTDVAVVALVVAHGTDADLDPREARVTAERLAALAHVLTGEPARVADLSMQVEAAIARYGRITVPDLEALVASVGERLGETGREAAFEALMGVAEADGVVSTMEQTVLRHVAQTWGMTPDE